MLGPEIRFRTVLQRRPEGLDLLGKNLSSSSFGSPKNGNLLLLPIPAVVEITELCTIDL